ncbi:MAG TPA: 3-methyl-2-oxobutanoate hydroxymethyltransferase [Polyangia bacterium]|nr:3-methyl-2-oxobutanoate hydroxymethyltransferase [Polyangia bacterium]
MSEKLEKITVCTLRKYKAERRKIAMLTAYDATFARLLDEAGVDVILVGDSLGMVIQGHENTLPVTLDEMIYHTRAVARGVGRAHLVADMPFLSYQASVEEAVRSAGRLLKEGGAHAVKLEGGAEMADQVRHMVRVGIPVMGHVGLTPQSVHAMGGFKVQGKTADAGERIKEDAHALEQAGAYAIVLEGMPAPLAAEITAGLEIPTIGIGAGPSCDGQVLVIYDLLGMNDAFKPKFVKRYEHFAQRIRGACSEYIEEVRAGKFPSAEHSFSGEARIYGTVSAAK